MDYRRCFGLRALRLIDDSTILVPQLENFSLFATPFLDLNSIVGKLIEGPQKDAKGSEDDSRSSEDDSTGKRTTRQMLKKKDEADTQKLPKEASKAGDSFGIVLNVVTVKPEEIAITFGDGNSIEVKVVQKNAKSEYGCMTVSRNCTYKYELPKDVDKKSLVALWTSDEYLIILPNGQLRKELLNKSIKGPEEHTKSPVKDELSSVEVTGSKDPAEISDCKPGTSKGEETKSTKPSKSENGEEKSIERKLSDENAEKLVAEGFYAQCEIPLHQVTRMLRPELDIFMLRKYLLDLESYVSTARKFIENSSFVSFNSKSAERCIRFLANLHSDEYYEKVFLKGVPKMKRKFREPSPDSGYSTGNGSNPILISMLRS